MDPDAQALRLVDLLHRLSRSIADDARRVQEVATLDLGDFIALRAIASGKLSPGDLSRHLHSHPAATSRTITGLAKAGLVSRVTDPVDSRKIILTLTPTGAAAVERIAREIRPSLQRRLDTLPGADAANLLAALETLLANDSPE
ncbi:MarR family winged helix-turn-helix transcriptional regulator [Mycolicibacterium fluoranthenivorans]|uniref:DNA-binding MarR family transcriptional regulator n=1 Tax=Mycolicibacterium fluoranthenivorans TaxID=258505 RepID=A0A7X5U0R8_9MYCO|nr:MarR family transcriptional regulator [Mycolicibacterium fluoranthenivorans]MCV7357626.1 MarR family transcriptional regulator [Mycolicibacterium fluoranthenivorans]NIH96264.1 DNA-binding MarR family transcriptional regulator [Mycolicibacterium fluoranthenivorans]